jgi:hypothetical protein
VTSIPLPAELLIVFPEIFELFPVEMKIPSLPVVESMWLLENV